MITRTLRGIGALIALAAVLIGWPIALMGMARAVSEWLPDLSDPAGLLARPDAGGLFLLIVLTLGWVAWSVWTVSLLLEVAAQARGVPTPRLGGVFPQRSAAALVTAIAVAFAVAPAVALADTAVPPHAAAESTPAAESTTVAAGAPADGGQAAEPADPTGAHDYTVVPGDTLWDIAEDELTDPYRWTDIADANRGIPQPDGQHLDDPDLIRPGWTLNIPDDPAPTASAAAADPAAAPTAPDVDAGQDLGLPTGQSDAAPLTPPAAAGPSAEQPGPEGAPIILPTTPLLAAGPANPSDPADPAGPALPPTPLTAGVDPQQDPPAADAVAWELTDEGRSNPRHGVLGLPDWITDPLIPTRPKDAPDLVDALRTI